MVCKKGRLVEGEAREGDAMKYHCCCFARFPPLLRRVGGCGLLGCELAGTQRVERGERIRVVGRYS
jgi:hypothetical protein